MTYGSSPGYPQPKRCEFTGRRDRGVESFGHTRTTTYRCENDSTTWNAFEYMWVCDRHQRVFLRRERNRR